MAATANCKTTRGSVAANIHSWEIGADALARVGERGVLACAACGDAPILTDGRPLCGILVPRFPPDAGSRCPHDAVARNSPSEGEGKS